MKKSILKNNSLNFITNSQQVNNNFVIDPMLENKKFINKSDYKTTVTITNFFG